MPQFPSRISMVANDGARPDAPPAVTPSYPTQRAVRAICLNDTLDTSPLNEAHQLASIPPDARRDTFLGTASSVDKSSASESVSVSGDVAISFRRTRADEVEVRLPKKNLFSKKEVVVVTAIQSHEEYLALPPIKLSAEILERQLFAPNAFKGSQTERSTTRTAVNGLLTKATETTKRVKAPTSSFNDFRCTPVLAEFREMLARAGLEVPMLQPTRKSKGVIDEFRISVLRGIYCQVMAVGSYFGDQTLTKLLPPFASVTGKRADKAATRALFRAYFAAPLTAAKALGTLIPSDVELKLTISFRHELAAQAETAFASRDDGARRAFSSSRVGGKGELYVQVATADRNLPCLQFPLVYRADKYATVDESNSTDNGSSVVYSPWATMQKILFDRTFVRTDLAEFLPEPRRKTAHH